MRAILVRRRRGMDQTGPWRPDCCRARADRRVLARGACLALMQHPALTLPCTVCLRRVLGAGVEQGCTHGRMPRSP